MIKLYLFDLCTQAVDYFVDIPSVGCHFNGTFMLLCIGSSEIYGREVFKAWVYTRYTCFKAHGSAVNLFLLYHWEGLALFFTSLLPGSRFGCHCRR